MDEPPLLLPLAARWKRLLAFFCDELVISVIGWGLGSVGAQYFAEIGVRGRLVGWAVLLIYYAVSFGPPGGGQTVGHRLLGLRVVRANGTCPRWWNAILRALILCSPFAFLGISSTDFGPREQGLAVFLQTVPVVVLMANGYFLLLNFGNRGALHDRIARTSVIDLQRQSEAKLPRIWLGHFIILGLIPLLTGTFGPIVPVVQRTPMRDSIESIPHVKVCSVDDNVDFTSGDPNKATRTLDVVVRSLRKSADYRALASEVAARANAAVSPGRPFDQITITVLYGYNLGIWGRNSRKKFVNPPAEWPKSPEVSALRFSRSRGFLGDRSCLGCGWSHSTLPTDGG